MDFRFFLVIALIAAIVDILGKLAKKRAGAQAPGTDPSVQGWEELEWLPGAHAEVPEPDPPRAAAPAAELSSGAETGRGLTRPRADRVAEYRDRSSRQIEGPSRDRRSLDPRSAAPESRIGERGRRPGATKPAPARPEARRRTAGGTIGGRLGLTTVGTLRRVVVAREVLGPPLALREDDSRL